MQQIWGVARSNSAIRQIKIRQHFCSHWLRPIRQIFQLYGIVPLSLNLGKTRAHRAHIPCAMAISPMAIPLHDLFCSLLRSIITTLIIIYRDKTPLIKRLEFCHFQPSDLLLWYLYSYRSWYLMIVDFIKGFFIAWWHDAVPHYFYKFTTLQELNTWQSIITCYTHTHTHAIEHSDMQGS